MSGSYAAVCPSERFVLGLVRSAIFHPHLVLHIKIDIGILCPPVRQVDCVKIPNAKTHG